MTKAAFDKIREGLEEAVEIAKQPVGHDWLETFRQHFPDEFSEPEDEQARSSIERGNGQRTMAQRPGAKS